MQASDRAPGEPGRRQHQDGGASFAGREQETVAELVRSLGGWFEDEGPRVTPEIHNICDSLKSARVFEATRSGYALSNAL